MLASLQLHARDRRDAREGLAAEAARGEVEQVLDAANLGGGVALERQLGVLAAHAAAVVAHFQVADLVADGEFDPRGAGVDGILHQLLHDAGHADDHLAGGDLVDEGLREDLDRHGVTLARGGQVAKGFARGHPDGESGCLMGRGG
jgi:hypothetical protein